MVERVSSAEYEYFRTERQTIDSIRAQGQYMLFLCLRSSGLYDVPPLRDPAADEERPDVLYGKAACTVSKRRVPRPDYQHKLNAEVYLEANTDPGWPSTAGEFQLIMKDGILLPSESYTLSRALVVLFPLIVDRYEARENITEYGLTLGEGFLTGQTFAGSPRAELVASSGNDDGSAPALVPNHPKSPLPSQYREAELPQ